jgi:hypothetical protein
MSEQGEQYVYSDALLSLVPVEIVNAMKTSNQELFMDRVQETGKTTCWILQQVLSLVKEDSDQFPLLQEAVDDLLQFLEQCEASLLLMYS